MKGAKFYTAPALVPAALPKHFYFVAVDGRPRRTEQFATQAAAEKSARELARYVLGHRVTVFRAEPTAALRDHV